MKNYASMSRCPHCGYILEEKNSYWSTVLCVCTLCIPLLWPIAMAIICKIYDYNIVKLENPYFNCPRCNGMIRSSGKYEWGELSLRDKKNWTYRGWMTVSFVIGGAFLLLTIGLIICLFTNDMTGTAVCSIIDAILFLIIGGIGFIKRKRDNEPYITISSEDYALVNESIDRLKKRGEIYIETNTYKISTNDEIIEPKIQYKIVNSSYEEENKHKKIHTDIGDKNGENQDELIEKANIKISTGIDLINIYFQASSDNYKRSEISLYNSEKQFMCKYYVNEESFFISITGLAFGIYFFEFSQYDTKENILFITEKKKFVIKKL